MSGAIEIDEELDVRGLGCASVLIRLAGLRRDRPAPWRIVVHTDDAGAPEELPAWCRLTDNTFVGLVAHEGPDASYHLVLEPKDPT